jgi:8-oxo-dGTP diphosphatase
MDHWAIPGGFVRMDETLEEAAMREIEEETGVTDVFLEQLYTFGAPNRDPRTRVVTVAYYALVPSERIVLKADTDASDAQWFEIGNLPPLAFDHDHIVKMAQERLQSRIETTNIAYGLLPARFKLSDLQGVYEIILGRTLDKRNFRKKILASGLIEATEKYSTGAHRPAQLFRWKKREVTNW